MAGQTLIPAGDFRTSYAADTTVFPTATSRNAMIAGIALICFAPHVVNEYILSLLIQIGIFGIAALGLNIVVGFTGQISIGHAAFFGTDSTKYGLIPEVITDPREIHELTAFFSWTAWASAAERPGHTYSYTNNWPPEPRVGDGRSAAALDKR